MYIHIHVYTYIRIYKYININSHIHVSFCIYVYIHKYIHTYIHTGKRRRRGFLSPHAIIRLLEQPQGTCQSNVSPRHGPSYPSSLPRVPVTRWPWSSTFAATSHQPLQSVSVCVIHTFVNACGRAGGGGVVCIHIYRHIYMYRRVAYVYTFHMYICTHIYVYISKYILCTYVYQFMYIYIYVYTHICITVIHI